MSTSVEISELTSFLQGLDVQKDLGAPAYFEEHLQSVADDVFLLRDMPDRFKGIKKIVDEKTSEVLVELVTNARNIQTNNDTVFQTFSSFAQYDTDYLWKNKNKNRDLQHQLQKEQVHFYLAGEFFDNTISTLEMQLRLTDAEVLLTTPHRGASAMTALITGVKKLASEATKCQETNEDLQRNIRGLTMDGNYYFTTAIAYLDYIHAAYKLEEYAREIDMEITHIRADSKPTPATIAAINKRHNDDIKNTDRSLLKSYTHINSFARRDRNYSPPGVRGGPRIGVQVKNRNLKNALDVVF
jgi:hypothetical protein